VQFENLFFNEVLHVLNTSTGQTEKYTIPLDQRIYVLEDIDCQSDLVMERKAESSESPAFLEGTEKLDLSFLLNILDGVLEIPGRIVIMTSNFIDKLDHALIRPGRIDVIAHFKKCLNVTLIEMMEFFYDIRLSPSEKARFHGLQEYKISPAEMGKIMFEHFDDYRNVIGELENKEDEKEPLKLEHILENPDLNTLTASEMMDCKLESKLESKLDDLKPGSSVQVSSVQVSQVKPNLPVFQKIMDDFKSENVVITKNVFITEEEQNEKARHFFEHGFTEAVEKRKLRTIENTKLGLYLKDRKFDKMYDPYNCESDIGSLLEPALDCSVL
jgi:hypothetical protein